MKKIFWLFLIFLQFKTAAQSGWTRNKGGFFGKMGVFTLSGKELFTPDGEKQLADKFYQTTIAAYAEYGITKNLTAILNYPAFKFQGYEGFSTVSGIGDPQLELKFALFKKIPVVSFTVGAELPFAKQNNISRAEKADEFGNIRENNLPTGDGDFNYWGTLAVSTGFGQTPGWFTIWSQYNNRTKGFRDQIRFGAELGYKWTPQFWTNARLTGVTSQNLASGTGTFISGDGAEFTIFALGASFEFVKHWSLTFDYQTYSDFIVKRKNLYSTPLYQLGISAEF